MAIFIKKIFIIKIIKHIITQMTKQKYIGIENELTSFNYEGAEGFTGDDFQNLLKNNYFRKYTNCIRSDIGNGYYIDGSEIETITPPIALNKGFATRLTNALLLGRNYIITNTPHMKHTGYSMHWNLSHDEANFEWDQMDNTKQTILSDLSIPFQLFGLTPISCGFNIREHKYNDRFEILGDSLTNEDQIKATALLLGAYSSAIEHKDFFKKNAFPLESIIFYDRENNYATNKLTEGRYTEVLYKINKPHNNRYDDTQAQNILELFYDWLSPYVYKLGERAEINNLEAFIKGDKKLEMDDLKYFKTLKNKQIENGEETNQNTYSPLEVETPNGPRSPILQVSKNKRLKVPIEGKLLGIYASNSSSNEKFITTDMEWEKIKIEEIVEAKTWYGINKSVKEEKIIYGVHDIYKFAEKYQNKKYRGSRNISNIKLNNTITDELKLKLDARIKYDESKDLSAL